MALLWPFFFIVCVWTVGCVDMMDCVLIYIDICVFRYIDMDGCKLYVVDKRLRDCVLKIFNKKCKLPNHASVRL